MPDKRSSKLYPFLCNVTSKAVPGGKPHSVTHLLTLSMVLHVLCSGGHHHLSHQSERGNKSPGATNNFSELTQHGGGPHINYQASHLPSGLGKASEFHSRRYLVPGCAPSWRWYVSVSLEAVHVSPGAAPHRGSGRQFTPSQTHLWLVLVTTECEGSRPKCVWL